MDTELQKKGALTKAWQAHGKAVKYLSFGGLLMTGCFLPTAIVNTYDTNPDANVLDVFGTFYGTAATNAGQNLLPALGLIFEGAAALATEIIAPGTGYITAALTP